MINMLFFEIRILIMKKNPAEFQWKPYFFLLVTALAFIVYTRKNALPSFRLLTVPVPPSPVRGYNWYPPDLGQFYFAISWKNIAYKFHKFRF